MVFSSMVFLCVFLPIAYIGHLILPDIRWKNKMLLLISLVFYAYGEPVYVGLMLLSAFVNYLLALMAEKYYSMKSLWITAAACVNLGILGVFKYARFLVETMNEWFGLFIPIPQIALPVGISFFTFQAMSYVFDVTRGVNKAQKNFSKVLLYIGFFPQLIAGPIVKYHDIEQEIEERTVSLEETARGLRRFIAGLTKKVLVANTMGLAADQLFHASFAPNIVMAWVGALSYMMQIYFDFSGYSDMAIGMGWMFGFHFKENFYYPYLAGSVREFWRRWHISLSGWFKEYLYIPLGGNRKGRVRTCINKLIVFLCTGIWHGANTTFLFWGFFHGCFLMAEEAIAGLAGQKKSSKQEGCPAGQGKSMMKKLLAHIYVFLVICVGFVWFRADTFAKGTQWVAAMFTGFWNAPAVMSLTMQQLTPLYLITFIAAVAACTPVREKMKKWRGYEGFSYIISVLGLIVCVLNLAGGSYNPFIYFRF